MILVVDGQRIYNYEYQEPPPIATNSLGFIDIEFRLSEEWDGYICTAQFVQHKENGTDFIASKVLYNNHVTFPDGIIPGVLEISLFGYKAGEAERGTTFPYVQPVYRSGFTSTEETPIPPTPDLYSQFLESFETTKQSIENAKQIVQNASKDAITAKDYAVEAAESIEGFESNAEKYAKDSAMYAGNSKMFATLAEQSAASHGFFYTYIDKNGHLHYVRSDGLMDLNMRVENGRLIASYGMA